MWFAFRFFIFVQRQQHKNRIITVKYVLWFAFRFFIFVQRQQRGKSNPDTFQCCDLLSDFLSLSNGNNILHLLLSLFKVVICFQIFYLCPTATTSYRSLSMLIQLWFAFRFFIFVQRQQRWRYYYIEAFCCDLLSDFLSLSNGNNKALRFLSSQLVVICFQIFYLCPTATTIVLHKLVEWLLWFAFRFFIFVQRQQLNQETTNLKTVVICFQIFYLCPTATTQHC